MKKADVIAGPSNIRCLEVLYDYNQTRPSESEKRTEILRRLLGAVGDNSTSSELICDPSDDSHGDKICTLHEDQMACTDNKWSTEAGSVGEVIGSSAYQPFSHQGHEQGRELDRQENDEWPAWIRAHHTRKCGHELTVSIEGFEAALGPRRTTLPIW